MDQDQEQHFEDRLTYIDQQWQGEPLSDEDADILSGAIPVLAQAFSNVAPQEFPDGSPTGAQEILQALGGAVGRTVAAARTSGDFETPWRLFVLMRYVRQPHNVPLSTAWVSLVSDSRETLKEMGDGDALAAVEAGAEVNRTWWEQNGQWSLFTSRLVDASTPQAVNEVVVMPPVYSESVGDSDKGQGEEQASTGTVNCPDCGGLVSVKIDACPHCGCPTRPAGPRRPESSTGHRRKNVWLWAAALLGLGLIGLTTLWLTDRANPRATDPDTRPRSSQTPTPPATAVRSLRVGKDPTMMTISPDGRRLYATNMQNKSVTVVDTDSEVPVARVKVGRLPADISVSRDGDFVYVSCLDGLYELDTARNTATLLRRYELGPGQTAEAPDQRTLYVGTDEGVDVFDTYSESVVGKLAAGEDATTLALSPRGSKMFIGDFLFGTVSEVSTVTGIIKQQVSAQSDLPGVELEASPDGNNLYVLTGSQVVKLNVDTFKDTGSAAAGTSPSGMVLSPDGQSLYVGDYRDNNVVVIDTDTMSRVATIDVGYGPEDVAISPDGRTLYVSVASEKTIQVVSLDQALAP